MRSTVLTFTTKQESTSACVHKEDAASHLVGAVLFVKCVLATSRSQSCIRIKASPAEQSFRCKASSENAAEKAIKHF